eukprot:4882928-Pyramimonas_sp.AAC.1
MDIGTAIETLQHRDEMVKILRTELRKYKALAMDSLDSNLAVEDTPAMDWQIARKSKKEPVGRKSNHLTQRSIMVVAVRQAIS